uniref:Thioredoxin reductase n=1 Tax=Echinococcus granulosus TaxID=6210 RepID=A0A068WSJ0_ECHGR|nr:hypothetical protein EgrG_002035700 [Echinococcus granulosus]
MAGSYALTSLGARLEEQTIVVDGGPLKPGVVTDRRERVSAGSNGCDTQARAIDGASHRHKRYVDWPPT